MKNNTHNNLGTLKKIRQLLKEKAKPEKERKYIFFKTGPGDYAEHDQFLGSPTPEIRKIAKQFQTLPTSFIKYLISSPFNEERLLALFLLINRYQKNSPNEQEKIYQFYCNHLDLINNWNLVDASAHLILGAHLFNRDKKYLLTLSSSKNLWHRRIAIISTWYFIRNNDYKWTVKISKKLLKDKEDLIHKAVGWMLREMGKRDKSTLTHFLEDHANSMPRTMLRYAIEKLEPKLKRHYLEKI